MANETTATLVANLGHGTNTVEVFHKQARGTSGLGSVVAVKEVPKGQASSQISLLAANSGSVSSYSEAGSAASNTALGSVTAATLTPASVVICRAPTDHAGNRVDPSLIDLASYLQEESVWNHEDYIAQELVNLFDNFTAIGGTAGADLVPTAAISAYLTLCSQVAGSPDVIWTVNKKGAADLSTYMWQSNSPSVTNPRVAEVIDLIGMAEMNTGSYLMTLHNKIHVYELPASVSLPTDSGDDISAMFVPYLPGLNGVPLPAGMEARFSALASELPGKKPLAPGLAVAFRSDPVPLSRRMSTDVVEAEVLGGIPVVHLGRAYSGQGLAQIDTWASMAALIVSADSGIGVRYSST